MAVTNVPPQHFYGRRPQTRAGAGEALRKGAKFGGHCRTPVVWFAFSLAGPISRLAGRTGLNIMTRLMGLVLAALAVEFIAAGIRAYVTA